MERLTRNKALTMLLITLFSITLFALLYNMMPDQSRSVQLGNEDRTDETFTHMLEDAPDEEDPAPVTTTATAAAALSTNAKDWKPKKDWGRLSTEIEEAIGYNVRMAKGRGGQERILLTAVANEGMAEYTLNWIASLERTKQADKFLVFAIDEELVTSLTARGYGRHVVRIPQDWFHRPLSGKFEAWLSTGYTPITHAKSLVVERLLYTDVTVWFSDVDIVFTSESIYDYLIMKLNARKETETVFSQETEQKMINSGFYLMRPTNTNKRILDESIRIQDAEQDKTPPVTQQRAMNRVLDTLNLNYQTSSIVLLDLMLFPHGQFYFNRGLPTKFNLTPMMVHANYRKGDNKKKDLQKYGLWYI